MGTLLKWPVVRLVSSNYPKRQRLSWSKLLKQIQAAKVEVQNILRESEQEAREGCLVIGSCTTQSIEKKCTYRYFGITGIGSCNYSGRSALFSLEISRKTTVIL